jgi:acetolactate synthase-1/2/3 large subunit
MLTGVGEFESGSSTKTEWDRTDRVRPARRDLMKVHEALARSFVAEQVECVFSVMGDGNLFWLAQISELGVSNYNARHEAGAVAMADGYARASGRLGIATVTCGPGLTQTATSLTAAVRYRVPLVLFLGDSPRGDRTNVQYLDQRRFAEACGAEFIPVATASTALRDAKEAFRLATELRTAVVLNVPIDVQDEDLPEPFDYQPASTEVAGIEYVPDADQIDRAAGLLASSLRPIFIVGRGAIASGARDIVEKLAKQVGALLSTTMLANGWLEDVPFQLGLAGTFSSERTMGLFAQADCVVAIGAGLNDYTTQNGFLFRDARVIQIADEAVPPGPSAQRVDCFLQGDARKTLEIISDMFTEAGHEEQGLRTDAMAAELEAAVDPESIGFGRAEVDGRLDPRYVAAELDRLLPDDCLIVQGAGHFWTFPIALIGGRRRRFVYSNGFGSIGQALPIGVGAAIGCPERPLVVIEGDTSLFMHLQELDTAARYGVPMTVVVMNDDAMGAELHKLRSRGFDGSESIVTNPDFGEVATALGGSGVTVRDLADLEDALKATNGAGPHVVDVKLTQAVTSMGGMGAKE